MKSKAKGARSERKSIAILEASGYTCMKAGASLGIFDVIAIGANDFVLLQVKTNRNASPAERETIQLFKAPANAKKLIHVWMDYERQPRVMEIS